MCVKNQKERGLFDFGITFKKHSLILIKKKKKKLAIHI